MRVPDALFSKEQLVLNHDIDLLLWCFFVTCPVMYRIQQVYMVFYPARLVEAYVK